MELLIIDSIIIIIIIIYVITLKKTENYSTIRDPKEYGNYGYYDYYRLWQYPVREGIWTTRNRNIINRNRTRNTRELYNNRCIRGYENKSTLHKNYMSGYYQPWM